MNNLLKKILSLFFIFFSSATLIFADSDQIIEIDNLIKQGTQKNFFEIQEKSSHLPAEEKQYLFDSNQLKTLRPILLNLTIGFGIGSYLQGDSMGGIVGSICGGAALGIFVISGMNHWAISGILYIINGFIGVIRVIDFSKKQNDELRYLLFGQNKVSMLNSLLQLKPVSSGKYEQQWQTGVTFRFRS